MAIYSIMVALIVDILLNAHLLTPMFGPTATGTANSCSAIKYYTTYTYFFEQYWPIIAIMTVSMIPACLMIAFLVGIVVNIHTRRNRLLPTITRETSYTFHSSTNAYTHACYDRIVLFHHTTCGCVPICFGNIENSNILFPQPVPCSYIWHDNSIELCIEFLSSLSNIDIIS
jgi:hypothetical protein